ncbi:hypothetical protein HN371_25335 [Candidatus Poribacteria bacterium]|nr:hypothetical protein [Candidatus Poribacteria bacterium]MBT5709570.1 hypothetical protein [Candidatus Poribacteria bacterium]MBT7098569.1 hypothetical protein [Candidatus Poribacteria bacterium]MBT7809152.1 hypothetical protein [Candidatus Poribacteria bacterium]
MRDYRELRTVLRAVGCAAFVGASALLLGCEEQDPMPVGDADTYSLQLDLTSFSPHASQKIEGRVVDVASGMEVARTVVTGAPEVTLFFPDGLVGGRTYRVDFYADLDRSDEYTPPVDDPPTAFPDHQWRLRAESADADGASTLMDVSGDVHITFGHNANWVDIDWPDFERNSGTTSRALSLRLNPFAPHAGQRIEGRVVNVADEREVGRADVVGEPDVTLDFGRVLADGQAYRIDFYADLNMDGEYTAPVGDPATSFPDHQWSIDGATATEGAAALAAVSGDVAITFAHNANWVDIDWPGMEMNEVAMAALELTLSPFAPHAGQRIEARVVDVDTDTEVGRVDVVGDVEVTLSFGDVLAMGASYRVDFYADLDGNGEYTPPVGGPAASFPDHQWSIDGATAADGSAGLDGVSGDVSITFGHNADWVDIDWPGMEANG